MIHKLTEIVPIIEAYARGETPAEQLIDVGDQATIRAKALSDASTNSMNELLAAMQMNRETGNYPESFIERIADGRRRDQGTSGKKSIWKRLFGG